eukprot:UN03108
MIFLVFSFLLLCNESQIYIFWILKKYPSSLYFATYSLPFLQCLYQSER